ncbi:peptidylprolyl isomerase [candidate division WOR-3 bacterium]|nr:peptidylprolyl isomerase [candidate division WOR-3 bacterium]
MGKFLLFSLFISTSLVAETIDKIVAIAGDRVITQSKLDEATLLLSLPSSDSLRLKILNQLIEHNLLLIQAEKETLEVNSEEISDALKSAMLEIRSRFPSDEIYEKELEKMGLAEEDLRERYKKEIKENLLIQKLFQKKFGKELTVSDIEVLDFYNTNKDSIPREPEALRFKSVFVPYKISDNSRNRVKRKAKRILNRIKRGESFKTLALKYSDDPGTRSQGGDLGFLNQKELLQEFRDFVSELDAGETKIMQTQDAYHIIRCEEKQADIVHLRDIVIKISPSRTDSQATLRTLNLIKERFKNEESLEELDVKITSSGENFIPLSETPFSESLEFIEISEIYTFNTSQGFELIKPLEKREERMPTFPEIKEQLKQFIYQRKLNIFYQKLISKLKEEIFVKILPADK